MMSLLASLLFVLPSFASSLSVSQLLSFECTATTTAGVSVLSYSRDRSGEVTAVRNSFLRTSYRLNSAGQLNSMSSQYFALMGGSLGTSQAISFVGPGTLRSGENTWSGSVFLASVGGSVFAPVTAGAMPIGSFRCASVVLR
jgi:hypothetical protein